MDFQELLDHADYNTVESKYKGKDTAIVKYSSVLPPPKKVPKPNVMSDNIKKFLEKKKREEEAKVAEARKQREQLLAIRSQNSKNSKKAKIMASRTKDNDFSKIRLTDDEVEAKKKREAALIRQNLANKVERMKARIEMEEKEKLLPKKRKRKSKNGEIIESCDNPHEDLHNSYKESSSNLKNCDKKSSDKSNNIRKLSRLPPPNLSLNDLLKLAEKKQHEPMDIVVAKKEEVKLMTKKERKIMEEDLARRKRKQEKLLHIENGSSSKSLNSAHSAGFNKKNTIQNSEKSGSKKPLVIHVEKDTSKSQQDASRFKIPKSGVNVSSNKNVPVKHKESNLNSNMTKLNNTNSLSEKSVKSSLMNGQKKAKSQDKTVPLSQELDVRKKKVVPKKNGIKKINPPQTILVKQSESQPKFDEEALTASLEKRIRDRMEKEIEERIAAKLAQLQALQPIKAPECSKPVKNKHVNNDKKVIKKPILNSKHEIEKMNEIKKQILQQRNNKPKLPEKKVFHKNPYLEPPRRLLEPQRPPRPSSKRKIESDDDDDDDDDDMSDFIDDGPSQNEEDYSKYIKEIFGYDRNRYLDVDDDDIKETSYAEQIKEEVRSARIGHLEDLEEERLENERMKKKKMKKKK